MFDKLFILNNAVKEKIECLDSLLKELNIKNYHIYNCNVILKDKETIIKFKEDINSIINNNELVKIFVFDTKTISCLSKIDICRMWNKTNKNSINRQIGCLYPIGSPNIHIYKLESLDLVYKNKAYANNLKSFFKDKKKVVVTNYKELEYNLPVCVDIETTGLDHTKDKILTVGIGTKQGVKSFIWSDTTKKLLQDICYQTPIFVGHNLDFDLSFLMRQGCTLPRKVFDTLVAAKFYKSNLISYKMENLCFNLLDLSYHTEFIDKANLSNENIGMSLELAAKDVQKEIELAKFLGKEVILGNPNIRVIFDYYMDAVRMFTLMRNNPVVLSGDLIQEERSKIESEAELLREKISRGVDIANLNSSKQLREVLFKQFGLSAVNYTETGEPSADIKSLYEMNHLQPTEFVSDLIKYKKLQSILSKFYNKYQSEIYSIYSVYGAKTGRTSCSSTNNENLQQLPPDMLFRWLINGQSKFDYSQIELKIGAFVSGEKYLMELFKYGKDVHDYTQQKIQGQLNMAKVPKEYQRRVAKTLNFGAFYGGTGTALHNTLMKEGIYLSLQDCYKFAYVLNEVFPNQKRYRWQVEKELIEKGYVDILPARKSDYDFDGLSSNNYEGQKIVKEAANAKIQGFASDVALSTVVDLWLKRGLLPLIYRHDEAVYTAPYDELVQHKEELESPKLLELYGIDLGIPLKVDFTNLTGEDS